MTLSAPGYDRGAARCAAAPPRAAVH